MKRIIGVIMLAIVFVLLIGATCEVYGVKEAIITWVISFLLAIVILIAIFLIKEE